VNISVCVCVCECMCVCVRARAWREGMARYLGYFASMPAEFPGGKERVHEYISSGHGNYATCHGRLNNFTDYSILNSTL